MFKFECTYVLTVFRTISEKLYPNMKYATGCFRNTFIYFYWEDLQKTLKAVPYIIFRMIRSVLVLTHFFTVILNKTFLRYHIDFSWGNKKDCAHERFRSSKKRTKKAIFQKNQLVTIQNESVSDDTTTWEATRKDGRKSIKRSYDMRGIAHTIKTSLGTVMQDKTFTTKVI